MTISTDADVVRVGVIGAGGWARNHMRQMLNQTDMSRIDAICEPNEASVEATHALYAEFDREPPPNAPDFDAFIQRFASDLDAALIVTPHNMHFAQAKACMEAGLDVLLEKPMVMNAEEAEALIEVRNRTGRLLVVGFTGGMHPAIRTAVKMIREGEIGEMLSISATIWQRWKTGTTGTWRQSPAISGGGFMFDTGAHMLNTVADLAGEGFSEVAAWMDDRSTEVDILAVVAARLKSGGMVTLHGNGDAGVSGSQIYIFGTEGVLVTGAWGGRLEIRKRGDDGFQPVELAESLGTWQQFLLVRRGELANPCPPEVGLRMARLWDAIKESAAQNGQRVTIPA